MRTNRKWLVNPFVYLFISLVGTGPARGEIRKADNDLVERVSRGLLAVTEPVPDLQWPPTFTIEDRDEINAFAAARREEGPGNEVKIFPRIVVYNGMMKKVIKGDADRLALILGHELGHVLERHIVKDHLGRTNLVHQVFSRKDEIAADIRGLQLTVKAGYSYRKAIKGIEQMMRLGLEYSSFEGLGKDHPSWKDRLAIIDKEQGKLWTSMSAFENGVLFLTLEQYASAEECFRRVCKEFPQCPEAWSNLGSALLMEYCDALDEKDLSELDVGLIVCGAFYRRPKSLEALVRGQDPKIWLEATEALQRALQLQPDLALAKVNLGMAYLVRPLSLGGKDLRRAMEQLAAFSDPQKLTELEPPIRGAVLVNTAVADVAAGELEAGTRALAQSQEVTRQLSAGLAQGSAAAVQLAALYNRGLLLATAAETQKHRDAVHFFEEYLQTADPASAWWPLAYRRYKKLCQEFDVSAKEEEALKRRKPVPLRLVTGVKLPSGFTVTVGEKAADVAPRLGRAQVMPVVSGTSLARCYYPELGIELLVGDEVLAICLRGAKAPTLPLRRVGLGGKTIELQIGMSKSAIDEILADQDYDFRQLDSPNLNYRFYPKLGLALRLHNGKVEELVVSQIPRQKIEG